jgi:hypothetical protein
MTPEEHIKRAEKYLADDPGTYSQGELNAARAAVHVAIANHKKKFPSDSGRPRPSYPTGYGDGRRPIVDNPQA